MKRRNKTAKGSLKPACEQACPWLFDYACRTGELDQAHADLVRQHLAGCQKCRDAASDIMAVVNILHSAPQATKDTPGHLSADRRRRILNVLGKSGD